MASERELEKKWLLTQLPKLPEDEFEILSVQTFSQYYLSPTERVRVIDDHGIKGSNRKWIEHFTKTIPDGNGASIEERTVIKESEYHLLLPYFKKKVEKIRTTWVHIESGLHYEFDYIPLGGAFSQDNKTSILVILEIEFQEFYMNIEEVNEKFILPSFMEQYVLLDATGLKQFSNYNLANKINETILYK